MNFQATAPGGKVFTKHTDFHLSAAVVVDEPSRDFGLWCWVERGESVDAAMDRAIACGYDPDYIFVLPAECIPAREDIFKHDSLLG